MRWDRDASFEPGGASFEPGGASFGREQALIGGGEPVSGRLVRRVG
ncbi:MAG TPA: hypothetical protein VF157_14000 [Chloroflexota bacterium]